MRTGLARFRILGPLACALALAVGLGCVTEGKRPRPVPDAETGGGPIEEINLLAVPVALNLDQTPGLDGFVLKIYATTRKRAKPIPIEEGKVEVLMFDGMVGLTGTGSRKPLHIWTFTAVDLRSFEIHGSIGTGYQLAPLWGDDKPTGGKFTIFVRYTPPKGNPLVSAPSIISASVK
jgi:hypothetical protein